MDPDEAELVLSALAPFGVACAVRICVAAHEDAKLRGRPVAAGELLAWSLFGGTVAFVDGASVVVATGFGWAVETVRFSTPGTKLGDVGEVVVATDVGAGLFPCGGMLGVDDSVFVFGVVIVVAGARLSPAGGILAGVVVCAGGFMVLTTGVLVRLPVVVGGGSSNGVGAMLLASGVLGRAPVDGMPVAPGVATVLLAVVIGAGVAVRRGEAGALPGLLSGSAGVGMF